MYHTKCTGKFSKKKKNNTKQTKKQTIQQKESKDGVKPQLTGPVPAEAASGQHAPNTKYITLYTRLYKDQHSLWSNQELSSMKLGQFRQSAHGSVTCQEGKKVQGNEMVNSKP